MENRNKKGEKEREKKEGNRENPHSQPGRAVMRVPDKHSLLGGSLQHSKWKWWRWGGWSVFLCISLTTPDSSSGPTPSPCWLFLLGTLLALVGAISSICKTRSEGEGEKRDYSQHQLLPTSCHNIRVYKCEPMKPEQQHWTTGETATEAPAQHHCSGGARGHTVPAAGPQHYQWYGIPRTG